MANRIFILIQKTIMLTLQVLKTYLQKNGATTLAKLAKEFMEEPDQILCLAEHYIAKGRIHCERKKLECGTACHSCIASKLIKLSWVS